METRIKINIICWEYKFEQVYQFQVIIQLLKLIKIIIYQIQDQHYKYLKRILNGNRNQN